MAEEVVPSRTVNRMPAGQERWQREVLFKLNVLMERTASWREGPEKKLSDEEQEEGGQSARLSGNFI